MRFTQFIIEFLTAGLVATGVVILMLLSIVGIDVRAYTGGEDLLSLASVPGALLFTAVVAIAYPVGYGLYLETVQRGWWLRRKSAYQRFNDLMAPEMRTCIQDTIESQLHGMAQYGRSFSKPWERDANLVRTALAVHDPNSYTSIRNYYTRLTRSLASMNGALVLVLLAFPLHYLLYRLIPGSKPLLLDVKEWLVFGGAVLLGFVWSAIAYRKVLPAELRFYYRAFALAVHKGSICEALPRAYLFAYGSNMSRERLDDRVDGAFQLDTAHLEGYEMLFNKRGSIDSSGKANIRRQEDPTARKWDRVVCGVLYSIPRIELVSKLDGEEYGYQRERVQVKAKSGRWYEVYTYVAADTDWLTEAPPLDWYVDWVLEGAREHQLPKGYVRSRILTIEAIPDENRERAQGHARAEFWERQYAEKSSQT